MHTMNFTYSLKMLFSNIVSFYSFSPKKSNQKLTLVYFFTDKKTTGKGIFPKSIACVGMWAQRSGILRLYSSWKYKVYSHKREGEK